MTFAEWWKKHAYYDDVGTAPKFCAGEAWNHQQARIDELEAKLNTRAMPEPTEAIDSQVDEWWAKAVKQGVEILEKRDIFAAGYFSRRAAQENSDG